MTERYVVATAFLVTHAIDIGDIADRLDEHHTVLGHRVVNTLADLLRDPRFVEYKDDLTAATEDLTRQGHNAIWGVVDIVWDGEEDDWFDAELQAQTDHLAHFCCPGSNDRN